MDVKKYQLFTMVVWACLTLSACGGDNASPQATDYSQAAHWLSIPVVTEAVDVFYFYPTAWTSADPANPHVCAIDEPTMLTGAASAFARQATAFETVGNIYAPYYRQNNGSPIDRLNVIAGIPTLDAIAAFDYYIRRLKNNRPFILVGHSQGGTVRCFDLQHGQSSTGGYHRHGGRFPEWRLPCIGYSLVLLRPSGKCFKQS